MKEEKYYLIMYRRIGTYGWRPLEQTEYTEKEADSILRSLKKTESPFVFRKKHLFTQPVQELSARS